MIVQALASALPSGMQVEAASGDTPWLQGNSELRVMFQETANECDGETGAGEPDLLAEVEKGKAEVAATMARYAESISRLSEATRTAGTIKASEIVDTAVVIAEALLGRELGVGRGPLLKNINDALASIQERPIVVRVHREDFDFIHEAKGRFSESGASLVSDEALNSGECIIESSNLSIDSTVASRLAATRDSLVDLLSAENQDAE